VGGFSSGSGSPFVLDPPIILIAPQPLQMGGSREWTSLSRKPTLHDALLLGGLLRRSTACSGKPTFAPQRRAVA